MKEWQFVVLLLVGASVLGATVLREPIAHAASPFENVIVANTKDNPVPVAEQGTVNANITNSRVAVGPAVAAKTASLSPITAAALSAVNRPLTSGTVNASLVEIQFDFGGGLLSFLDASNHPVLQFRVGAGHDLVLPLAEAVEIRSVSLFCDSLGACGAWINIVGS